MRIRGNKMDEPLDEQPLGQILAVRAKRPANAAGGNLHQAATIDERGDNFGAPQDALVAFRMG